MARVVPAYPHSSLNTIMLCSITAGRVRWNIARRVCVLASICVDVGFINLGLKRELRPVSSTSIIHDAFNKFCHEDSFHLHLMTQWLCGPTAAFITHTHSAMKAALWKPTRPPVLAQTLQNQCLHMEMFPLVGINLVQGWKKKIHQPQSSAAQKIHNRKNLEKFSHDPEEPLSEKTLSLSSLDDGRFLLVISLEFTSHRKHFDLELCWSHADLNAALERPAGWLTLQNCMSTSSFLQLTFNPRWLFPTEVAWLKLQVKVDKEGSEFKPNSILWVKPHV